MIDNLYTGVAYYPELWNDADIIDRDIELMKQAGINVVRMGEFMWSTIEPEQDVFKVDVLVDVIDKLNKNGISTIMCTPTATPPVWVSYGHDERMIKYEDNIPMSHGGRQQVCTNNAFMRERSMIITEKVAQTYGKLEGVIGWQIDNELKGNVWECMCDTCQDLWHKWLKDRYKTIEKLNEEWGTGIWSQHYNSFEQVQMPKKTPMGQNQSLKSAFMQFSRDMVTDFSNQQAEIIRKYSDFPITHNASLNHFIDNQTLFKNLDFVSFDHYSPTKDYHSFLSWCNSYKTIKPDVPYWVMETAPTFSGAIYGHHVTHENGYIAAEAAVAYATGAKGFSFWHWRQHRVGVETYHGSIISAWGDPGVGFKNVQLVSKVREELKPVIAATKPQKSKFAITYSDLARVFIMSEPAENGGLDYVEKMQEIYKASLNSLVNCDLAFDKTSLDGYKVLWTPLMPYLPDEFLNRILEFVREGGIFILGPRSCTKNAENNIHLDCCHGAIEKIAGVKTLYNYPMSGSGAKGKAFGVSAELGFWSSVYECDTAKEIGIVEGGVTPGTAFLTEQPYGKGKIVMLGSMPMGEDGNIMIEKMINHYAEEADIIPTYTVSKGTIAIPRGGTDGDIVIAVNMDGKGGELVYNEVYKIEPFGYKVIKL